MADRVHRADVMQMVHTDKRDLRCAGVGRVNWDHGRARMEPSFTGLNFVEGFVGAFRAGSTEFGRTNRGAVNGGGGRTRTYEG